MARPRLLLLSQWFDPEPTFKGLAFAKALEARGFEVEVVTGFPNYPGGRLYDGYEIRWRHREILEGIPVTRVALYPSHDRSALRRIANYVSFGLSSAIELLTVRRPDIIYAYHPPLTTGAAALVARYVRGIPVVYDIQDLWPDALRASGLLPHRRLLAFAGLVSNWIHMRMDRLVVLSEGLRRVLVERGVPAERIEVIHNWCDETMIRRIPDGAPPWPDDGRFRVLYAGSMGPAQALDAVLDAAILLHSRGARVSFVLLGAGIDSERLRKRVVTEEISNVEFRDRVPMTDVGRYLQAAQALLVHLRADPIYDTAIPSKTQAYMALGRPLLMAVRGDTATLTRAAGCAEEAVPQDPRSIADAAERLATLSADALAAKGERGRAYYDTHLSFRSGVDRFATLFTRILAADDGR